MKHAIMDKKIIIITSPHSIADAITNSSTEIFVVDKSKTREVYQELIDILCKMHDIDYESRIYKFNDYPYKDEYTIPAEYSKEDLYVINASNHNELLGYLIEHCFHIVNINCTDD